MPPAIPALFKKNTSFYVYSIKHFRGTVETEYIELEGNRKVVHYNRSFELRNVHVYKRFEIFEVAINSCDYMYTYKCSPPVLSANGLLGYLQ